jgi:aminomethyltransferase
LQWVIDWDVEFLGRDALAHQREHGHASLVGLTQMKGIPRHGYDIQLNGHNVGKITSGTQSPVLGHGIALAYVDGITVGATVDVDVRGRLQSATVVRPPFVK